MPQHGVLKAAEQADLLAAPGWPCIGVPCGKIGQA